VGEDRGADWSSRYVAAGATYLVLSGVLFWLWLAVDWLIVLFISVPTFVASMVLLRVGWPRLRRERAERRARAAEPVARRTAGMRRS
jgi:hypothetical protein